MSTSSIKEVECWKCGNSQKVPYGGEAGKGIERCDSCGEVIAETEMDSITTPSNKEQALSIQERHGDFTTKEKILRRLGRL